MQAIDKQCFTLESLNGTKNRLGRIDLRLLERSAYALELLGRLVDAEVDLIFKGGTSLLLRLHTLRRLSIDVDIICGWPAAQLDPLLKEIGRKPPFLNYEEHVRRKDG